MTIPHSLGTRLPSLIGDVSVMAFTLLGSRTSRLPVSLWPRKVICFVFTSSFCLLMWRPCSVQPHSSFSNFLSWSSWVISLLSLVPYTSTSAMQLTLSRPSSAFWSHFWKISLLTANPKGNWSCLYHPNRVWNVVSRLDSWSSIHSLDPVWRTHFSNESSGKMCSRTGKGCHSLLSACVIVSVVDAGSHLLDFFSVTTIWLTHGVSLSTLVVICFNAKAFLG